jgi:hypothetical protein
MELETMSSQDSDQRFGTADQDSDESATVGSLAGMNGQDSETVGALGEFVEEAPKSSLNRTTLVMFGVVALGAAGVWFMYKRSGPATAAAGLVKEQQQAKQTINSFLGNNGESIRTMEQLLKNTERVVQQFLAYPSMTQVPLADLRTNPFRFKAPRAANAAPDDAADKRRREEERVAMLKAVQGLQLQSIMYSENRRACMINNSLFREGQSVDQFTVETITASSVVVKNGPYRFELRMQR